MHRTIKFRKRRVPERNIYDRITASYFYTTIPDHELLKAAFEVARDYGVNIVQMKIRGEGSLLHSKVVFEVPELEHPWFDIVYDFLGRVSKYIKKVKWW